MSLSIYEQQLLEKLHNDIKLRLPETMNSFEQLIQKFSMNIDVIADYMIIEAIKLDRDLPQTQRVFSSEEEKKYLQKVKENYLNKNIK